MAVVKKTTSNTICKELGMPIFKIFLNINLSNFIDLMLFKHSFIFELYFMINIKKTNITTLEIKVPIAAPIIPI